MSINITEKQVHRCDNVLTRESMCPICADHLTSPGHECELHNYLLHRGFPVVTQKNAPLPVDQLLVLNTKCTNHPESPKITRSSIMNIGKFKLN